MSYSPPINRRELKKSGIFDEDRFFRLLSERCNYIDKETAKTFYMALVKLIVSELRANGVIRLPHLGDMALVKNAPRSVLVGKSRVIKEGMYVLKFYVTDVLKAYFSKLNASFGWDQKMDPRQKVLKHDLGL